MLTSPNQFAILYEDRLPDAREPSIGTNGENPLSYQQNQKPVLVHANRRP